MITYFPQQYFNIGIALRKLQYFKSVQRQSQQPFLFQIYNSPNYFVLHLLRQFPFFGAVLHFCSRRYYNFFILQMRFGEALSNITIPEWKQCYLNYQVLKIFVTVIKEIVEALALNEEIQKDLNNHDNIANINFQQFNLLPDRIMELNIIKTTLNEKLIYFNELFYTTYFFQAEITELFYQMKVMQIEQRFQICLRLTSRSIPKQKTPLFLTYTQYAYIEISYLSQMREANLQAERKILKKHKKYAKKKVETPQPSHDKITRIACIEQEYMDKIEDLYVQKNKELESKVARQFLRLAAHKDGDNQKDYLALGIGVGASIIVLGAIIFIIVYTGQSIDSASVFSRDFPTWRGTAIFILYIWVLGFDLYCFQKYKISHRLIFKFDDHHYSTSAEIFKLAGLFTSMYLALFLFYMMMIAGIIKNTSAFSSEYMASVIWLGLIAYLFSPLPIFNYQGRLFAMKLLFRCIVSPLMGVEFSIVWMTDQWISMATPLRDLAYTVCYYTRLDFKTPSVNPCKNNATFEVVSLVVVIALSYRMLQCIRLGISQGNYFCSLNFANTIKYTLSLGAALISYVYNIGYVNLLWLWIVISAISTFYSYYWDLKNDWSLLQPNCKNVLLRKYLTFEPKRNYYLVMAFNFIMRLSWMLTISPNIALIFGNSSLLTLVSGSIEIVRRGIWNLLRVEKEHINNCVQFKAIPDMTSIQKQLQQQGSTQAEPNAAAANPADLRQQANENKMRDTIKKEFITLIKNKIQERDVREKQFDDNYEETRLEEVKKTKKEMKGIAQWIKGKQ